VADPQEQEKLNDYIRSQEFIVTILKRKAKYAPLIPEAENFWHPTIVGGMIDNNNVETNLDRSHQPLFLDLRDDIYAELNYLEGSWFVKRNDPKSVRSGCSRLDAAKAENPALDLTVPIEEALKQVKEDDPMRPKLQAALEAARQGRSLEEAIGQVE
jgi:hypothetical protein